MNVLIQRILTTVLMKLIASTQRVVSLVNADQDTAETDISVQVDISGGYSLERGWYCVGQL